VREIDDLPATVWWGVQVRQSSLHIAQCIARVQESCAALQYSNTYHKTHVNRTGIANHATAARDTSAEIMN
jgi:hypothetical protein